MGIAVEICDYLNYNVRQIADNMMRNEIPRNEQMQKICGS